MIETNKAILKKANAAITQGDTEGFLAHCTDDIQRVFVGERILEGKEAVRQWMATAYSEPQTFQVDYFIAEGDFVTVLGTISLKEKNGKPLTTSTVKYGDFGRVKWLS